MCGGKIKCIGYIRNRGCFHECSKREEGGGKLDGVNWNRASAAGKFSGRIFFVCFFRLNEIKVARRVYQVLTTKIFDRRR